MRLRFHCQTAAFSLTKAQPLNNIIRTTLQALTAVLGGAQSLHTNGLDEAYSIPSEEAMKIALRTQQVLAEETGVPCVADPLGGSYYVEALTNQIEEAVFAILARIDDMGGTVRAVEEGFFEREIADSAYQTARRKSSGEQVVIGLNKFVESSEPLPFESHRVHPEVESRQIARLRATRERRDNNRLTELLDRLEHDALDPSTNLMPTTMELVKARASLGEIVKRLRHVLGSYQQTPLF
jgi:methylmalonyl-CoA mutase N-terminal domain/subunit